MANVLRSAGNHNGSRLLQRGDRRSLRQRDVGRCRLVYGVGHRDGNAQCSARVSRRDILGRVRQERGISEEVSIGAELVDRGLFGTGLIARNNGSVGRIPCLANTPELKCARRVVV